MNTTTTEVALLKGATVQAKPLSAEHQKLVTESLQIIDQAEAQADDLKAKVKQAFAEAGQSYALGVLSISEAVALAMCSADVDARRAAVDTIRRGCKTVISETCDRCRPALVAFHRNRAEALRAEAQKLETAERETAERLGQKADAFEPSELLKRLQRTHTASVERARSIEEGQRLNISEIRELIS